VKKIIKTTINGLLREFERKKNALKSTFFQKCDKLLGSVYTTKIKPKRLSQNFSFGKAS
jgi:hypothetical protein